MYLIIFLSIFAVNNRFLIQFFYQPLLRIPIVQNSDKHELHNKKHPFPWLYTNPINKYRKSTLCTERYSVQDLIMTFQSGIGCIGVHQQYVLVETCHIFCLFLTLDILCHIDSDPKLLDVLCLRVSCFIWF